MLVSVARVAWVGGLRSAGLLLAIGMLMDFGNAAMLTFTVFVLVELINQLFPGLEGRWKVVAALVAGQATAISVANSDWGVKQVIDDIRLDQMNGFSLFLVGIALSGLAVGFNVLVRKGIANIGENLHNDPPNE